jgi:signal transduction histidine kinase
MIPKVLDIYIIINTIVILSLVGLGSAVLIQNRSLEINRVFTFFVFCISVWIISNYISNDTDNSTHVAVVANYFVFGFSFMASIAILWFSILLTEDKKARKRFKQFLPALLIITALCFTPLVIAGVELQPPVYAVLFGPLVLLYAAGLFGSIIAAGNILRRNIRHSTGSHRDRLRVIFKALVASMTLLLITQFILPTTTGWFGLTNIGILSMLILVFGFYYSVAKHKLFDLRFLVVRSLAYILSLGLILTMYAVISTELSKYLFTAPSDTTWKNLSNVVLVIFAAVSYGPAKRYFNRVTNKLFYRDAYEPQEFLNQVNRVVVTNSNLEKMLSESTSVIEQHIKSEYTLFNLSETAYTPKRVIGAAHDFISEADTERFGELTADLHDIVLITDELEVNDELKRLLRKYNIALFAKLVTNLKYDLKGIGFLALGAKKSGNPYSKQDVNIMRIIAGELVIAIENTLRFEEIENFNVTLQDKVDDATKRLKRANDKLKALDETKDEFISMASHQLRTPLTSVKGYVSMVLEGDAGELNPTQRKLLEQSFASSQRMVYLIADLLNLSRLRTGKFVIEAKPTNLAEVIESEVDQLKASAAGRNLTLTYEKPKVFSSLMLDETKIRQVIMNFADNAIYYTPSGGKINIQLRETKDSVEFTVNDNGIGIPADEQHHLFNKFYRAKNAQKARPDGTGLGLFMAKKVIIAQGGAIVFHSKEGKGSTFGFTFSKQKLKVAEPVQPQLAKT